MNSLRWTPPRTCPILEITSPPAPQLVARSMLLHAAQTRYCNSPDQVVLHSIWTIPFGFAPVVCSSRPKRTGDSMRPIQRFVYSVVLALSALTLTPTSASAQEMHGSFTLSRAVRWQNYAVPAGDYRFEVQPKGPSALLLLRKVSGSGAGFLILANAAESSKPA